DTLSRAGMLAHLDIRDYALIEHLALDLEPGLTVLTGETGAGKSILIEALGLALGDRADSSVVRKGAARATVSATVTLDANSPARRWLEEQALDEGGECLLRRVIGADGRSRAFINGNPVPLASLRALGMLLIDIHGQHAHHALLGRDHQLALLDGYAGHPDLLADVAARHDEWRRLVREAEALEALVAGEGGGA